jgi:Ca2+-binding RTX toxin-like protein
VSTTPGDQLNILTSDGLELPFVFAATTDGSFTDAPDQTITWTSIESFTIDGNAFIAGDLYVITGNGSDRIIFFSTNGTDTEVRIDNEFFGPFAIPAANRIVAFSQGGNDTVVVQGLVPPIAEFHGGTGNDYLAGTTRGDFMFGGLGSDIILAGEGNNFIHGDDPANPNEGGMDRLEGRSGDDIILGGFGNDRIQGRDGNDTLSGGDGNDQIFGGSGDDFSFGGPGFDLIRDSFGDDVIFGADGADIVFGGNGDDLIIGGTGADRIRGDSDDDYLANGSSTAEADIDAALADLGTNAGQRPPVPPTSFDTDVLPGLMAWRNTKTVAFGTLMDDDDTQTNSIDDMTGGAGTDIFDAALEDMVRDLRTSEGDMQV